MRYIRTVIAILFIILFSFISVAHAATEQRIALVIGNNAYRSGPLKNPVNDATAIATKLKKLGFVVTLKKNTGQQDMDDAIREFGRQLKKKRGVGLFYYAGHGIQIGGVNYLLPVNARIEKESDVKFQSVNADMVLAEMENAENGLNIVILDACRDNPFARSFRSAARGLAIISNAPSGTFISYSTGANQVARDGDGKNSPYTEALLENMDKPGLTINKVFMNVRSRVKKETGQVPWELSSLESDFYFMPGKRLETLDVTKTPESKPLLNVRENEPPKTIAMGKVLKKEEIKSDERFIDNGDGTVTDTKTGLMWASKDNGREINWEDAKSYCENYRVGGFADWRMPTQDELAGLYDSSIKGNMGYHLTKEITLTACCPWASETRGSEAAYFTFAVGDRYWIPKSNSYYERALPVRSGK